ncbi:hypothetical protein SAMN04487904_10234 [Actinopolyspora lacussalsi subsp. righensis]|uniref:Uncharacterized protein n=1 Tax=Actinopolyspora righensis TaxID=995060 RepID=A0A1I6XYB5_9ACTN|nr:hypothetical protein [Actinopolyspora righensis]SFT43012.1 hypothetical protein SAMN04487904_10234 [Actinopolyspora righensis]
MDKSSSHEMPPDEALGRAGHMSELARDGSRWFGYMLILLGLFTTGFLVGQALSEGWIATVVAWLFAGCIAGLFWYVNRQRVLSRTAARIIWKFTLVYMALAVVTSVVTSTWLDDEPLWQCLLALLPALPCWVSAWWVLRR